MGGTVTSEDAPRKRGRKPQDRSTSYRPATLQDIGHIVGVSAMTVHNVLNGKRRNSPHQVAIFETARRLNFTPNPYAQRLVNKRSHNVVCLFSVQLDMGMGARKIQAIQGLLVDKGVQVPLYTCGYKWQDNDFQASLINELSRQRPEAIICNAMGLSEQAVTTLRNYADMGGLMVSYDLDLGLPCDQVILDREYSTYQATRHLLDLGHQRVGFGHHQLLVHQPQRLKGYKRALQESGIEADEAWSFEGDAPLDYEAGGEAMAEQFLKLAPAKRPTALSLVNDAAALAFISRVQRAGLKVPEDLSVMGYDNMGVSRSAAVPLTTVAHPYEEIAARVVELLGERLDEQFAGPPRRIVLRDELIVRQSTAAPAASAAAASKPAAKAKAKAK